MTPELQSTAIHSTTRPPSNHTNKRDQMRYKLLGRSGLRVSEVCLGTMMMSTESPSSAGPEESRRILEAFADRGGNYFDTANEVYSGGLSERILVTPSTSPAISSPNCALIRESGMPVSSTTSWSKPAATVVVSRFRSMRICATSVA